MQESGTDEDERRKAQGDLFEPKLGKYMVRHNSKFRMRWDLLIIIVALWNCIFIPLNVAFSIES